MKPTTHICGATHERAPDRDAPEAPVAERRDVGLRRSPSGAGISRSDGRADDRAAEARDPHRREAPARAAGVHDRRQRERGGEPADRDRRLPDPEREPALRAGEPRHHCASARRLHARAEEPGEHEQEEQRLERARRRDAPSSASPHPPTPASSTHRSPTRSVARPHGISETTEPASDAEMQDAGLPEREVEVVAQRRRHHGDAEPDRGVRRLRERPGREDGPASRIKSRAPRP